MRVSKQCKRRGKVIEGGRWAVKFRQQRRENSPIPARQVHLNVDPSSLTSSYRTTLTAASGSARTSLSSSSFLCSIWIILAEHRSVAASDVYVLPSGYLLSEMSEASLQLPSCAFSLAPPPLPDGRAAPARPTGGCDPLDPLDPLDGLAARDARLLLDGNDAA